MKMKINKIIHISKKIKLLFLCSFLFFFLFDIFNLNNIVVHFIFVPFVLFSILGIVYSWRKIIITDRYFEIKLPFFKTNRFIFDDVILWYVKPLKFSVIDGNIYSKKSTGIILEILFKDNKKIKIELFSNQEKIFYSELKKQCYQRIYNQIKSEIENEGYQIKLSFLWLKTNYLFNSDKIVVEYNNNMLELKWDNIHKAAMYEKDYEKYYGMILYLKNKENIEIDSSTVFTGLIEYIYHKLEEIHCDGIEES